MRLGTGIRSSLYDLIRNRRCCEHVSLVLARFQIARPDSDTSNRWSYREVLSHYINLTCLNCSCCSCTMFPKKKIHWPETVSNYSKIIWYQDRSGSTIRSFFSFVKFKAKRWVLISTTPIVTVIRIIVVIIRRIIATTTIKKEKKIYIYVYSIDRRKKCFFFKLFCII